MPAVVREMTDRLRHRGPDDRGTWHDAEVGVALGSTRLAIIDLSQDGAQPMMSASGRYIVAFNGEIYNFADLRHELDQRGAAFRGHSDTEVMLAAFDAWGVEQAVKRLNGMFAFAVWDRTTRSLSLVRDRLGEKPLYYGRCGRFFAFASELKSLEAVPGFDRTVDRRALASYFQRNYVPAPLSIYENVKKLPAGTQLTVSPGILEAEPRAYWSLAHAADTGRSDPSLGADTIDRVEDLLIDSVRRRMVADVPVGAFLSGGIDSSLIVALMQQQTHIPIRTFSIGFLDPTYDESAYASMVASRLGTNHTKLYVSDDDLLASVSRCADVFDEPFADFSALPTLLLCELARGSVTVALSGDGADELFGGYPHVAWADAIWRRSSGLPLPARIAAARAIRAVPASAWRPTAGMLRGALGAKLRSDDIGSKARKFADLLESPDPAAMYRRFVGSWQRSPLAELPDVPAPFPDARAPWPPDADPAGWMLFADMAQFLPDDILVKVDRASMAASLEVRVPYLDHRLVEYAWRLDAGSRVHRAGGKYHLRQILYRYLPRDVFDRPKHGFSAPIGQWLRGPLKDWAEEMLSRERLRSLGLNDALVREVWHDHLASRNDRWALLWPVVSYSAWASAADRRMHRSAA